MYMWKIEKGHPVPQSILRKAF